MRALVVLALVMVAAPTASAERPNGYGSAYIPACDVEPAIYPSDGASEVPRNAHVWIVGGTRGEYVLRHGESRRATVGKLHEAFRVVEIDLGLLAPHSQYTLEYAGRTLTTFMTAWTTDNVAPEAPALDDVNAWSGPQAHLGLLQVVGEEVLDELTVIT